MEVTKLTIRRRIHVMNNIAQNAGDVQMAGTDSGFMKRYSTGGALKA